MTIKTLVIDQNALSIIDSALIDDLWFDQFNIPQNSSGLRRVQQGNSVYLLSDQADTDSGLLVVLVGNDGIFSKLNEPRNAFERVIRVALRQFDHNISLPVAWQPFHSGSKLSVYANPYSKREKTRLYFDRSPRGSGHVFAYGITDKPEELDEIRIDEKSYDAAIDNYLEALITDSPQIQNGAGHYGIVLSQPLGLQLAGTSTLAEWYERILSQDQIKFVDQPINRPIRLRGAAGTGKTQAMAVKCLRDLYADADAGSDKVFAFLTHSSSLAHEVVRGMFYALDTTERWAKLKTSTGRSKLWIGTLYQLAQEQLGYEKKGVEPLSLDGREGRELQRLLIDDAIKYVETEPRIALTLSSEIQDFHCQINNTSRETFIEELMNEFACVLDAENIRKGTQDADRYIHGSRESWQMKLPTENHRKLVIEIHDAYRAALRNQSLLSMDQMIADFGRYLSTHEWNQLRDRDGFDLIFIDEYHYFTRIEAMTLQSLFCSRAECSGKWPLIMAYDLKQSTNDASYGGGVERFRNPGVGESTAVELNKVYRSTPEIVSFLSDIDGSFPAIDLEGEFNIYNASSDNPPGDIPKLLEFDTNAKLVDVVFEQAVGIIRGNPRNGKKQVAVLCLNENLFDTYRKAGRIQDKMVPVISREDLRELRYAGNRCVFSMPEYVAGLQFDTVFLIHADNVDLQSEYLSQGSRRRYVSRVYLGASRASSQLYIATSTERGGMSSILSTPIRNRSLLKS